MDTMHDEPLDPLLNTASVRKLIDCSDKSLRRWIILGKFPKPDRKIGTSLRWRVSTLRKWLADDQAAA